jgi:hypothetical protein
MPCQPTATKAPAGGTVAHSGPSSSATGTSIHPGSPPQPAGSAEIWTASDSERQRWIRPPTPSMFSKTGP